MTLHRPRRRIAFTLIELLVAITVVVILAAITIGAMGGVQNAAARNRAKAEMAALSTAIESYKVDNGVYPSSNISWPAPSGGYNAGNYQNASRVLFQQLSGRAYLGAAATPGAKVYMSSIKGGQVGGSGPSKNYFIDPWGNAYGYVTNSPTAGFNSSFFDLWTTGGKTGTSATDTNAWIVNWPDPVRDSVN